ncbi:hypothetical protein [Streptomyces sp. CMB-StM0423]|uniref:hypothetical protein n=1 Tax=Streptomyces sp. CMB-StM0423 TaxID=2059884 RepID=UPI000C70C05F|nr:hypothetical protein [Streptomyces sp. CMB-StM0423]AUH41749.1 hypothetical protein CXR04_17360 [Streptomyces sp. CMB-StM0423]
MPGLTEAEEARLRRALGLIAAEAEAGSAAGAEAAGEEWGWAGESPGARRVRGVRRALAVVVSAAAVVAFCLLAYTTISGAGTDRISKDDADAGAAEDAGGDAGGDADADGKGLSRLENAACTKRLLEGTVAAVKQVPHPPDGFPWVEVTLTGIRWHVPPSAEERVTVRLPDPVEWNDEKPFARGEPLLVEDLGRDSISYFRDGPGEGSGLETVRGERLRALNEAQEEGVRCPSYFMNRDW